jgi:hypothetical protein
MVGRDGVVNGTFVLDGNPRCQMPPSPGKKHVSLPE